MLDIVVSVLLLVGSVFILVGAIGLIRLPDFFMRLHGPTKATTLGVGGMLLAAVLSSIPDGLSLRELLIALFLFITAPVSAFLVGQAALRRRLPSRAPLPEDFPGLRH
ncbi:MAG: Na+/H+ antiporter subunit G [Nitrospira sp.]|nr:Na+/H+ antiporter subunit G [Nitrospira sp.]